MFNRNIKVGARMLLRQPQTDIITIFYNHWYHLSAGIYHFTHSVKNSLVCLQKQTCRLQIAVGVVPWQPSQHTWKGHSLKADSEICVFINIFQISHTGPLMVD